MNFTDVEDKAIQEAEARKISLKALTDENIDNFVREMKLLRIKIPDYLLRASEAIDQAVEIIEQLLSLKIAYWYRGNVYFDPLKFPGFGKLFGLDMAKWPVKKRRFHKDTYPGMNWNLGDFILWHGCKKDDMLLGHKDRKGQALLEHSGPEHGQQVLRRNPLHLLRRYRQPLSPSRLFHRHPRIGQALSHGAVLASLPSPRGQWQEDVQEQGKYLLHRHSPEPRL